MLKHVFPHQVLFLTKGAKTNPHLFIVKFQLPYLGLKILEYFEDLGIVQIDVLNARNSFFFLLNTFTVLRTFGDLYGLSIRTQSFLQDGDYLYFALFFPGKNIRTFASGKSANR
mgnify:CR=1 FL=1